MEPFNVVLLPGGVLPAELAYRGLVEALGPRANSVVKDLEVYAGDEPAADYSLDDEVEGVLRTAAAAGVDRFHIVGYSYGGLVALVTAANHPDRVVGLGLFEPAPVGSLKTGSEDDAYGREEERLLTLPPGERGRAATSMLTKPGAEPPPSPSGPAPPWMAKRLVAFPLLRTWSYPLNLYELARFRGPVYVALGALSQPVFERQARRLAEILPQTQIERYEGLHHMNPPHLANPTVYAEALVRTWSNG